MIRHIGSQDPWLRVAGSSQSPYISPGAQSAGLLRYNSNNQYIEVYDGVAWLTISTSADIGLSPEAQKIMSWAQKKMAEEEQLQKLMAKHPGLKDLHEKLELMKALVAEDSKNSKI